MKPVAVRFPPDTAIEQGLLMLLHLSGGVAGAVRCRVTYEPLADFFDLGRDTRCVTLGEISGGHSKTPKWQSKVYFARLGLVKNGDVLKSTQHGTWQLSQQGRDHAQRLYRTDPDRWTKLSIPSLALSEAYLKDPHAIRLEDLGL
jgi:hypothetical protein